MIVDVANILTSVGLMTTNQYRVLTETNTNGEVTKSYSVATNLQCAVLPMTGQDLRNTPEGQYTFEDKVILTDPSIVLKPGDLIVSGGVDFEIKTMLDYSELVSLKKYIARKIEING